MTKDLSKHRHVNKEKKLFAYIMFTHNLRTDKDICKFLVTSPSVISQIRNDHKRITPALILRIYDKTGLSIEEIRKMVKEDV